MRNSSVLIAAAAMVFGSTGIAQANLITNGGFETGDFTGWTVDANNTSVQLSGGLGGYASHSGNDYAALGDVASQGPSLGTLSQTFNDTPGTTLVITLWLDSNGTAPNQFEVEFDSTLLFNQSNIAALPGYEELTYNVVGTGSDTLKLFERDDPNYLAVDDVAVNAVSAVPEPLTLSLFGVGIAGAVAMRRRKAKT
ncbi:MAG TPA: PEP-CTERM sorting domain-containing protein [Rhizomicrobium sp.]|jgi:hypothetical protein